MALTIVRMAAENAAPPETSVVVDEKIDLPWEEPEQGTGQPEPEPDDGSTPPMLEALNQFMLAKGKKPLMLVRMATEEAFLVKSCSGTLNPPTGPEGPTMRCTLVSGSGREFTVNVGMREEQFYRPMWR